MLVVMRGDLSGRGKEGEGYGMIKEDTRELRMERSGNRGRNRSRRRRKEDNWVVQLREIKRIQMKRKLKNKYKKWRNLAK